MVQKKDFEVLRLFLKGLIPDGNKDVQFTDDQSLILSRVLDSLAVTKLILFLEQEYDISLESHVHDISDLDSFSKIEKIIKLKQGLK